MQTLEHVVMPYYIIYANFGKWVMLYLHQGFVLAGREASKRPYHSYEKMGLGCVWDSETHPCGERKKEEGRKGRKDEEKKK